MDYRIDCPKIPLSDWQRFRKHFPESYFETVLDRQAVGLPDWFIPFAWGVAVASPALIHRVQQRPCKEPSWDWIPAASGESFRRCMGACSLIVRLTEHDDLWTIERWSRNGPEVDEVLCFRYGWTPLYARTSDQAKCLATYCHLNGPPPGFHWVLGPQVDVNRVAKLAKQYRGSQVSAHRRSHPR